MRTRTTKWLALFATLLAVTFFLPRFAVAQDRDSDDPPSRAARLSFTGGAVSFEPAGTDDWVTVVANRPVTTGDKLWTDKDGRAELRFGSTAVRLGSETGFSFLNLDDRTAQIRLTEGTINVRVKRLDEDETIEIDTPNLAFTVLRPGSYRISVNDGGDNTFIKVRGGDGEITGGGAAYAVHADQSGNFNGTDQISADIQNYGGDDDFDRWCADRDHRWDHSNSARYVSDDVVGYEDLDDYGGWRPVPEYGTVWFPHTSVVGWAPYRYGHWAYIAPWGWTWVDDAPWGFAPFHYGRWVVVGGVWGWVPVALRPAVVTVAYVRPVYAPALVAWVGGSHWGVGVAVGGPPAVGVAWFPLGPRDVYCPSYHVSERYVERVNVSNTVIVNRTQVTNVYNNVYVNKSVNVTNITYQNQHINNAVTATSQATFTSAQSVHNNMIRVNERDITAAPVAPTGPAVVPQQRSVLGAGATANVRPSGAATFANRPVVAKTAPPPAPVPFARQQQAIQQNGGRPIAISQERELQPQTNRPNVHIAPPARQMPPQNDRRDAMENRPNQPNQVNSGNPQNQGNQNRPQQQGNPNRPTTITNDNIQNGRGNQGNQGNPNKYNDRPPTARPNGENPQLEQKHQQELDNLRQQQDRERQKVEQQQVQQQQKLEQRNPNPGNPRNDRPAPPQNDNSRNQQNNDDRRQQQVQQQQQRQLEQLEQKHQQQQQKLEQKQQKEAEKSRSESKPSKDQKEPKNDRPPHR